MTNEFPTSMIKHINDKGYEKEEYITRLPREKRPWLKGVLKRWLWKVAFELGRRTLSGAWHRGTSRWLRFVPVNGHEVLIHLICMNSDVRHEQKVVPRIITPFMSYDIRGDFYFLHFLSLSECKLKNS